MSCQGIRHSTRCRRFFLGCVLALSGGLFVLMCGALTAQAGESTLGERDTQSGDMDQHGHPDGTVDMMTPHQKHFALHMR